MAIFTPITSFTIWKYLMQADSALLSLLDQVDLVLAQLDPQDYRRPLPEYEGTSLGQHFRHILEFFHCLEKGAADGIIDYAARERNLLYEDNPRLAAEAFQRFAASLSRFDCAQTVQVRAEFGSDKRPEYGSTIGRELLFVYDHAIHHLAIIKIGLRCSFPNIQTDRDLGVSPSTIKYWQAKSS